MTYDYAAVAERITSLTTTGDDVEAVMALLVRDDASASSSIDGFVAKHELPCLASVKSFEAFVVDRYAHDVAGLNDVGRCEDGHYAGFEHRDFGNEYGEARVLGAAMWAAFVRLVGEVHSEDDAIPEHEPDSGDAGDSLLLTGLKATARRLARVASWFTTHEGVEEMLDKSYVAGSVHRALVIDVLHDGIETQEADPVRTVARALVVLAGEAGGDGRLLAAAQAIEPFVGTSDQGTIASK